MGKDSKIEWTHHTFNPWIGCQKVGPGCDNCYAEAWDRRFALSGHAMRWGAHAKRTRTSAANWRQPIRWNRKAQIKIEAWEQFKATNPGLTDEQLIAAGFHKPTRPRVFCASLADVFDNAVPVEWRMDLFKLIADTPYLDWLILTKRIGNVMKMCSGDGLMLDMIAQRVWLGITVCNQEEADRDIPKLLQVPARVRFLSMEPLLGPVDLTPAFLPCPNAAEGISMDPETGAYECCSKCDYTGIGDEIGIDWVIVGGERGQKARPMQLEWVLSLRDQCATNSVPFLFKQWGHWRPAFSWAHPSHEWNEGDLPDTKTMNRMLEGTFYDGYPEVAP